MFLETDDLVVVIEGKRTEPAPTTTTTWMPVRHQMLRHIDAAWDRRGDRQLFGFFIVEGETGDSMTVPAHWREAARNTTTSGAVARACRIAHRGDPAANRECVHWRDDMAGCLSRPVDSRGGVDRKVV